MFIVQYMMFKLSFRRKFQTDVNYSDYNSYPHLNKCLNNANSEIIPALISRIRQNNRDNVVIRSKLYKLLNDVTNKFNDVIKTTPRIIDFQKMSNEEVLEHYYLSIGSESLWDSRELIMKAISEQNKLIREEYEKPKEASKETIKNK